MVEKRLVFREDKPTSSPSKLWTARPTSLNMRTSGILNSTRRRVNCANRAFRSSCRVSPSKSLPCSSSGRAYSCLERITGKTMVRRYVCRFRPQPQRGGQASARRPRRQRRHPALHRDAHAARLSLHRARRDVSSAGTCSSWGSGNSGRTSTALVAADGPAGVGHHRVVTFPRRSLVPLCSLGHIPPRRDSLDRGAPVGKPFE